ncbi:Pyruvate kinase [Methylocella tundrae]|uniref:Pyruvate kinase n=1 Tax=Methylocella tundrae TaxID=227605 RepID=A0A4U8Z1H3_METTU|nr:pyruvate kinase [Methylocella tundrae]WPP03156.1 pyruvate kinase [Methylocella tundrae]VFU09140.1 Pyruvate kinase [Methylocella tundrae]VTZ24534.1 Pyruvate kinase [Methylocella tundrae]VTZ50477.1 Pyruvate kinase [Methylocella tundrae]
MRRLRRCKIIATIGPASANQETLSALFEAGADVFRINMSHASHDSMREQVRMIRAVQLDARRPIGILLDLQGPKLRIGLFKDRVVKLVKGATFTLDSNPEPGDETRVCLPHPEILRALEPGHTLLIDDGKVRLHVVSADKDHAVALVDVAGEISNRKGVSLPDTEIPVSPMTDKDRADLEAGLEAGVDWVAVSFVQRPEDVAEVKKLTRGRASVMSKIEKPQAIAKLDEIVEISDGLMVARGDLGVEMPLEKVPGLQKRISRNARRLGKPVVVATQMLESMINSPVPTRAEVSDVATAVFEGADAVMLSAESAAGHYPVEAVATMNRIAEEVERDAYYRGIINAQRATPEATGADAIAVAARNVTETLDLKAIVAWTSSGATALRIARERPTAPILALTPNPETAGRLAIAWGVHAVVTKDAHDINDMSARAAKFAFREGFAKVGDRIIIVAGVPFGTPGATNMVRIDFIDEAATITAAPKMEQAAQQQQ